MAIDSKHNDKISNIVNTDDKMDKVSGSEDVVKRANESDNEVAASSPDRTSIKQEYKVKPQFFPRFTNEASSNAKFTDTAPLLIATPLD